MDVTAKPKVKELQGLRALAVMLVLVYHLFPELLPGGYLGVDVFFVLSGYFIAQLLMRDERPPGPMLWHFYHRRIFRIVPALLLVIATVLIVGALCFTAAEFKGLAHAAKDSALFHYNQSLNREIGYFDTASTLKPLLHLWSLGVEGQWYLVWPVLFMGLLKLERHAIWGMLAIAVASLVASALTMQEQSAAAFYLMPFRAWEFIAGAWVAMRRQEGLRHAFAGGAALLLLAMGASFLPIHALLLQILTVSGAVLMLAGAGAQGTLQRWFGKKVPYAVGEASYALYLWHWPWISGASILAQGPLSVTERLILIPLILISTYISWRWVEMPARHAKGRKAWGILTAAWLGVIAVAVMTIKHNGFPERYPAVEKTLARATAAPEESEAYCHERIGFAARYCRVPKASTLPSIAMIGDSHANRLYDHLQAYETHKGGVLFLGEGGCPPLYDTSVRRANGEEYCRVKLTQILDYVAAQQEIHTVLLTSRGPYYMESSEFGDAWDYGTVSLAEGEKSGAQTYADGLLRTVAMLRKAGKQVLIVMDNPEFKIHPLRCIDARPGVRIREVVSDCRYPRAEMEARNRRYLKAIAQIQAQFPEVRVVNLLETFCDARYCYGMKDENLLYMDFDHLSQEGARLAVAEIVKVLTGSAR